MGPKRERVVGEKGVLRSIATAAGVPAECVDSDSCPWRGLLASIDGYSASESRLPWMSWGDWGWKATVAASSDIAASGGSPQAILVSMGVPEPAVGVEVARGVGEASSWMGAVVLGGDFNSCRTGDAWIDVAVIGDKLYWSPRWGAKPGDVLVRAGPLGYGAVAQAALENPRLLDDIPEELIDYTRRPRPPIGLPRELARLGCRPHAAVDNSDGWSETLWLLALSSGVRVILEAIGGSRGPLEYLASHGINVDEAILSSGEDYTLLLSLDEKDSDCALKACRAAGVECEVIGRVEEGAPSVVYRGRPLERRGWDSFRPGGSSDPR